MICAWYFYIFKQFVYKGLTPRSPVLGCYLWEKPSRVTLKMNLPWSVTEQLKLLGNRQDRVTMETRPFEVLLRSLPLQSPWRPWQRAEYSCLAWVFTMATHAGPLWKQTWGPFLWRPARTCFRGAIKLIFRWDAIWEFCKSAQTAKLSEVKFYQVVQRIEEF